MPTINTPGNWAIATYSILGIIIGLLSVIVTKTVYVIEDTFEKIPVHWMWWPAIGGLVVGIIGYFAPHTLGVGYDNIITLLSGKTSFYLLLSLCLLKFISWAIALGSGTSGGTLAPILTIGGSTGALLGGFILQYFPDSGITIPLAVLVGMSAMFAGASRALLTSIIFAIETTSQSNAILPLLSACLASYFVSFFLMKNTIMTEKIARRGIKTPDSFEPDILEKITVDQVLTENGIIFSENNSIQEIRDWLNTEQGYNSNYFIISNDEGEFKGIISSSNLMSHHHQTDKKIGTLIKRKNMFINSESSLRSAVEMMAKENVDMLPVVSMDTNNITGILSYQDIISAYKNRIDEHEGKHYNISIKRQSLKILLRGQKWITPKKSKT